MTPIPKLQPSAVRLRHLIRVDGLVALPDGARVTPKTFVLGVPFAPQDRRGINGRAGWQAGTYEDALFPQEDSEGRLVLRFPNAAGADGVLHRRRFRIVVDKADYRPGDEFVEVYRTVGDRPEGDLIGVYTPIEYDLRPDTLEIRLVDAHFLLRGQRETTLGIWTGAAPRDAFEHYTRAWRAVVADTFDAESRFTWSTAAQATADNLFAYVRASSRPDRGAVRLEPRSFGSTMQAAKISAVERVLPSGWDSVDAGQALRIAARIDVRGLKSTATQSDVSLRLYDGGTIVYGIDIQGDGVVRAARANDDGTASSVMLRVGTLPPDAINGTHEFALEIRDRWVYTLLDGQVMGDPLPLLRRQGDSVGLTPSVTLWSPDAVADVTSFVVERTYDFLMSDPADKGDRFLAVAPEPGPLVGEWYNDGGVAAYRASIVAGATDATAPALADLLLAPTRDPAVRRDEDVLILGSDTAANTAPDRFAKGAGSWPSQLGTEHVSGRISGAVYLDFDQYGDFAFRAIADDRVRVWIGKTALRRDAIIDDWTKAGHGAATTTSTWVRAGSDAAAAPNPGSPTSPGVLGATPRSGWYPIVVEYSNGTAGGMCVVQVQRATQRGLWRTIGQSDYGARLRALDPATLNGYWTFHYQPGAVNTLGTLEDGSGLGNRGLHQQNAFDTGRGAPGPARGDQADAYTGVGGSSSYSQITSALPLSAQITVAAWVNPDTVAAGIGNIARRQSGGGTVAWGLRRSGSSASFFILAGGTVTDVTSPGGALAVGRWSLVVGTYDGATVRLYVDGALVASATRAGVDLTTMGAVSTYIGATAGAPVVEHFAGRITDLAIWGRGLTAGEVQTLFDARAAAQPFLPTAPIGVYREKVRLDSHYEQLKALGTTFGYQYRLEPRTLESGQFPGLLIPRQRVGRDSDYVLDDVEGTERQATVSAADTVDRLTVDAQGLGDPEGKTTTLWQAIDAPAMRRAWVGHHEYESLSDLTLPAIVAARAEALLALRSSPTLSVGVLPDGKRQLTDTFPLTGALAELAWRAGDAIRLSQPDLEVIDERPRQMTRLVWPIVPDGVGRPSTVFRQRPRGLDLILRRALRAALNTDRNYQGQIATVVSDQGKLGSGVGADAHARVSAPPGRRIIAARLVVTALIGMTAAPTVQINGTSTGMTVARTGPIDVTPWATVLADTARIYATLAGGTVTAAEYVLEVDYVT